MEARNPELPPQPPGAVNALLNGFNAVANNVSVIIFPVVLDLFLWLGPRLKVDVLFSNAIKEFIKLQGSAPAPFASITPAQIAKSWDGFNLFSMLRTYPMGVFSLMLNNVSNVSPLGTRLNWEVPNWLALFGGMAVLTCIGLLLGSMYFYYVSRVVLKPELGPGLLWAMANSLLLWVVWTACYFVARPVLGFGALLLANSPLVILLLFLLLAWPVTWIGLMIFFSTHGVFLHSKNTVASLQENFRVLRYGMPPMGWFALMAVVISQGMDLVWHVPSENSWMALVGILGHAFVSTGLLAGSFTFYRDLNSWVDEALKWLKAHQITSARA